MRTLSAKKSKRSEEDASVAAPKRGGGEGGTEGSGEGGADGLQQVRRHFKQRKVVAGMKAARASAADDSLLGSLLSRGAS